MNRLGEETSPYLLQHADNPVDWRPWGDEAFERARSEDKPILLSVGYAACHWCHVMEHESFEDEETARLMNERFVPVKVDREERPDVDGLYMEAVVALSGHGGWPMTVFLTPDGRPFWGGTYFPPEPRMGMPSFREVLTAIVGRLPQPPRRSRAAGRAARGSDPRRQRSPRLERATDVRAPLGRGLDAPSPVRPGARRVRRRSEVPAVRDARAPASPPRGLERPRSARDGPADPRPDGRGRHLRPARRRLPPLRSRHDLARAALREDALRQRTPRLRVPPRVGDRG